MAGSTRKISGLRAKNLRSILTSSKSAISPAHELRLNTAKEIIGKIRVPEQEIFGESSSVFPEADKNLLTATTHPLEKHALRIQHYTLNDHKIELQLPRLGKPTINIIANPSEADIAEYKQKCLDHKKGILDHASIQWFDTSRRNARNIAEQVSAALTDHANYRFKVSIREDANTKKLAKYYNDAVKFRSKYRTS